MTLQAQPTQSGWDRIIQKNERLALFVDAVSVARASRALGFDVDFPRLLEIFRNRGKLLRANYYTPRPEPDYQSLRRHLSGTSESFGFTLITQPPERSGGIPNRFKPKKNMNLELALGALQMAPHVDHILLFSGRAEFRVLVAALQRMGCRVSVVSTEKSEPPVIADELRRQADNFLELDELRSLIACKGDGVGATEERVPRLRP